MVIEKHIIKQYQKRIENIPKTQVKQVLCFLYNSSIVIDSFIQNNRVNNIIEKIKISVFEKLVLITAIKNNIEYLITCYEYDKNIHSKKRYKNQRLIDYFENN